jgi:hypothetical protein
VSSVTLMRRLSSNSRKNQIYKAFREVGRVMRTVALLRFLADSGLRARVTADLDLIVSYERPYWPDAADSLRDNSRLAPLQNHAGMWLTATSYKRPQTATATPRALVLPLPRPDEEPARIMGAGPGDDGAGLYWFVEAITSRQILDASRASAPAQGRQLPNQWRAGRAAQLRAVG